MFYSSPDRPKFQPLAYELILDKRGVKSLLQVCQQYQIDRIDLVHVDGLLIGYSTVKLMKIVHDAIQADVPKVSSILNIPAIRVEMASWQNPTTHNIGKVEGKNILLVGGAREICINARARVLKARGAKVFVSAAYSISSWMP